MDTRPNHNTSYQMSTPNTIPDESRDLPNVCGKLIGNSQKWPDHMGQFSGPNHPSQDEIRNLIASLMWTSGLQTDIDDFLAKYPHLAPPKDP